MSEEQAEHFNQRMKANEQTLARLAKKRRFKHSDYQDLLAQITAIAVTNDTKMQDVLNKLMELYGAYTDVLEKQLELIKYVATESGIDLEKAGFITDNSKFTGEEEKHD